MATSSRATMRRARTPEGMSLFERKRNCAGLLAGVFWNGISSPVEREKVKKSKREKAFGSRGKKTRAT